MTLRMLSNLPSSTKLLELLPAIALFSITTLEVKYWPKNCPHPACGAYDALYVCTVESPAM